MLNDIQPSSKDGKAIVPVLIILFNAFQCKVQTKDMEENFCSNCNKKDRKITSLEVIKQQVDKLEEKIDDNDNYERRNTLVLPGSVITN